jgi:hypothetical protein
MTPPYAPRAIVPLVMLTGASLVVLCAWFIPPPLFLDSSYPIGFPLLFFVVIYRLLTNPASLLLVPSGYWMSFLDRTRKSLMQPGATMIYDAVRSYCVAIGPLVSMVFFTAMAILFIWNGVLYASLTYYVLSLECLTAVALAANLSVRRLNHSNP